MYILKAEAHFDSAHFLSGYNGKCANIHGHRWKIEVEICAEELVSDGQLRGMVVDFGDLKKDIKSLADTFDHTLIYEYGTLKQTTVDALKSEGFKLTEVIYRPTAENFAKNFFTGLKAMGHSVKRVTVYETPDNCAVYEE